MSGSSTNEQIDHPQAPEENGTRLATLPRNDREELRITFSEYRGHKYLSLRCWYKTDDGVWVPTKKGVTIRHGEIPTVMDTLHDAVILSL